jgi:hypothetical protein
LQRLWIPMFLLLWKLLKCCCFWLLAPEDTGIGAFLTFCLQSCQWTALLTRILCATCSSRPLPQHKYRKLSIVQCRWVISVSLVFGSKVFKSSL